MKSLKRSFRKGWFILIHTILNNMKIMIIFECKTSTKMLNAALKKHSFHLFLVLETISKKKKRHSILETYEWKLLLDSSKLGQPKTTWNTRIVCGKIGTTNVKKWKRVMMRYEERINEAKSNKSNRDWRWVTANPTKNAVHCVIWYHLYNFKNVKTRMDEC